MKKNSVKISISDIAFTAMIIAFLLKVGGVIAVSGWIIFEIYEITSVGEACAKGKWNTVAWCMEGVTFANALGILPHPWIALFTAYIIDVLLGAFSPNYMVQTNKFTKY